MKHLKAYLIVAILAFSFASSQHSLASQTRPVKGIDVVVQKEPGNTNTRQTAKPNKDGSFTVELPGPGKYTISYADGPKKGQVIKTVTATKAGPVSVAATAAD